MTIVFYEAAEYFIGIALIIASVIMTMYARNRAAALPEDDKGAARPLYMMTLGVLLLGFAASLNFFMDLNNLAGVWEYAYFILAMLGPTMLTLAAFYIQGWERYLVLPIVLMAIGFGLATYMAIFFPGAAFQWMLGPYTLAAFIIPAVLFIQLTRSTKRVTSLAIALLTITYPMYFLVNMPMVSLQIIIVLLRTFAPAFLGLAFYMPDVGITVEPFGYSLGYTNLGFFSSFAISTFIVDSTIPIAGIGILTTVTMLAYGTGTYGYARWRENRSMATASLSTYFLIAAFSFSISILLAAKMPMEPGAGLIMDYINLTLAISTSTILCLSAFFALDWRRSLLLPLLVALPAIIYIWSFFAGGLPTDDIPLRVVVMVLANITLVFVPMGLYGLVWWRMKKAGAPNRNRPFFIFLGIAILAIAQMMSAPLGGPTGTIPSTMLLVAFLAFWLGVTGRADRLLKTTA